MKQRLTVQELICRGASHRAQRLSYEELLSLKVAFWDIESSDLVADAGFILCAGIKTLGKAGVSVHRIDGDPDYHRHLWDDSLVAKAIRDELEHHQVIIHHYGVYFDTPFLNTRLLINHQRLLDTSAMCFVDTWQNARRRLKLSSNRLQRLITVTGTPTAKTPLDLTLWSKAKAGHKPSLNKIVEHNIADVRALEEVTLRLIKGMNLSYYYVK